MTMYPNSSVWPCLAPFCPILLYLDRLDGIWPRLALFGPGWSHWTQYGPFGPVWPHLTPFGPVWQFMTWFELFCSKIMASQYLKTIPETKTTLKKKKSQKMETAQKITMPPKMKTTKTMKTILKMRKAPKRETTQKIEKKKKINPKIEVC